jgi:GntR family transcriptional regulator, rspAB operon transcriptional repressor
MFGGAWGKIVASAAKKAHLSVGAVKGRRAAHPHGPRESKAERVYVALKSAIVTGELPPDTPIDKGALCAQFGVSRLPVTTAINRLAFERLVVVEPQSGSYVSRISLSDMKQWMLVRLALEAEVAAACARLPKPWIEKLERNIAYQGTAVAHDDLDGFHALDVGFHRLMIEGLGLQRVGEILDSVRTHVDRTRRLLLPEPGRMPATYEEHRAIYRMIAAGKGESAGQAMRKHLNRVLGELEVFAKRHPNFFTP